MKASSVLNASRKRSSVAYGCASDGAGESAAVVIASVRQARRRLVLVVDDVRRLLRRFNRTAFLPVEPGLQRLFLADRALGGVAALVAREEAAMSHVLVAVAVAIHVIEAVGDVF